MPNVLMAIHIFFIPGVSSSLFQLPILMLLIFHQSQPIIVFRLKLANEKCLTFVYRECSETCIQRFSTEISQLSNVMQIVSSVSHDFELDLKRKQVRFTTCRLSISWNSDSLCLGCPDVSAEFGVYINKLLQRGSSVDEIMHYLRSRMLFQRVLEKVRSEIPQLSIISHESNGFIRLAFDTVAIDLRILKKGCFWISDASSSVFDPLVTLPPYKFRNKDVSAVSSAFATIPRLSAWIQIWMEKSTSFYNDSKVQYFNFITPSAGLIATVDSEGNNLHKCLHHILSYIRAFDFWEKLNVNLVRQNVNFLNVLFLILMHHFVENCHSH